MRPRLIELPATLYRELIRDLAASGRGQKESGAFLLGTQDDGVRKVTSYLMYDVIAPASSREHDYVALTGEEMATAWSHAIGWVSRRWPTFIRIHSGCTESLGSRHPMVSIAGHVALIVPSFATGNPMPGDLGIHRLSRNGQWESMFGEQSRAALHLTL